MNKPNALRSTSRRRTLSGVLAAAAVAATAAVSLATPASAARHMTAPAGFQCMNNRTIAVSPPRIWASYRTEQVGWGNRLERWDPNRQVWATYQSYFNYASFNYYGQGVTYWIGNPPAAYGSFINNRLHLSVRHSGHYRVISSVVGNQGGVRINTYLANGGHCYVP